MDLAERIIGRGVKRPALNSDAVQELVTRQLAWTHYIDPETQSVLYSITQWVSQCVAHSSSNSGFLRWLNWAKNVQLELLINGQIYQNRLLLTEDKTAVDLILKPDGSTWAAFGSFALVVLGSLQNMDQKERNGKWTLERWPWITEPELGSVLVSCLDSLLLPSEPSLPSPVYNSTWTVGRVIECIIAVWCTSILRRQSLWQANRFHCTTLHCLHHSNIYLSHERRMIHKSFPPISASHLTWITWVQGSSIDYCWSWFQIQDTKGREGYFQDLPHCSCFGPQKPRPSFSTGVPDIRLFEKTNCWKQTKDRQGSLVDC